MPLSAICTNTLPVCTELSIAEEAYPLTSPSSSDHWKISSDGSGEITLIEEDDCHSYRVLLPWIWCLGTHLLALPGLGLNQGYSLNLEN